MKLSENINDFSIIYTQNHQNRTFLLIRVCGGAESIGINLFVGVRFFFTQMIGELCSSRFDALSTTDIRGDILV